VVVESESEFGLEKKGNEDFTISEYLYAELCGERL
jgi:hypothetical protein